MTGRRIISLIALALFIATVWASNYLVKHVGPIRVWPTDLKAPAGVYTIGAAFLLRDTIQRFSGQLLALFGIAVGCGLSAILVDAKLAGASIAAFAASEIVGLAIFRGLRGNTGGPPVLGSAVVLAGAAAAALDSYVFLALAPTLVPGLDNVHTFFEGQFVAKLMVTTLAIPFILLARKRYPNPEVVTA